jgi:hypothetical protein
MDSSNVGGYIADKNEAVLPALEELDFSTRHEPTNRYDANPFEVTEYAFSKNSSGM